MSAVELRDVFRVHSTPEGDAAALQGLTLTVAEGELLAVLGPSGSGKTSMLRLLAGVDRASAGTARVFGSDLGRLGARALARYRAKTIGYVDQRYAEALDPELTIADSIALRLRLEGDAGADRRARELLDAVGLADRRRAYPSELSGGEQQRVAVCAALAHRPAAPARRRAHRRARQRLRQTSSSSSWPTSPEPTARPWSSSATTRAPRSSQTGRFGSATVGSAKSAATVPTRSSSRGEAGSGCPRKRFAARASASARRSESADVRSSSRQRRRTAPNRLRRRPSAARIARSRVVEVRGLTKRYPGRVVLDGFDADFDRGALTAVTGPSGSGKTTLLDLVAGLELPDSGSVELLGTDVASLDRAGRAALRRRHVGYVAQQPELIPFLSARENVELGLRLHGRPVAGALPALDAVGLAERAEQRVERLSGGERFRVAIARALAPRPDVLIADEPTSRLDEANALAVASLLSRLAREWGAAVVVASHDPLVVELADDRIELGATLPA